MEAGNLRRFRSPLAIRAWDRFSKPERAPETRSAPGTSCVTPASSAPTAAASASASPPHLCRARCYDPPPTSSTLSRPSGTHPRVSYTHARVSKACHVRAAPLQLPPASARRPPTCTVNAVTTPKLYRARCHDRPIRVEACPAHTQKCWTHVKSVRHTCTCVQHARRASRARGEPQQLYVTECICQLVLESQPPHKIVNPLFANTNKNIELTVLCGS